MRNFEVILDKLNNIEKLLLLGNYMPIPQILLDAIAAEQAEGAALVAQNIALQAAAAEAQALVTSLTAQVATGAVEMAALQQTVTDLTELNGNLTDIATAIGEIVVAPVSSAIADQTGTPTPDPVVPDPAVVARGIKALG